MGDAPLNPNGLVRNLKKGEKVPCDGHIYRDSDGQLWFALSCPLIKEARQAWVLSVIEPVDEKEGK